MAGYHAYWSSILLNMPPRYGNAPLTITPGIYIKTNIFGPTGSTGQGAGAAVSDHGGVSFRSISRSCISQTKATSPHVVR